MTIAALAKDTDTQDAPAAETSALNALDPAAVRKKTGLSTEKMAELLGMSPNGYSQWEQGQRRPGGPAYRLLYLIDQKGEVVVKALSAL